MEPVYASADCLGPHYKNLAVSTWGFATDEAFLEKFVKFESDGVAKIKNKVRDIELVDTDLIKGMVEDYINFRFLVVVPAYRDMALEFKDMFYDSLKDLDIEDKEDEEVEEARGLMVF